jgi:hypothetical protein
MARKFILLAGDDPAVRESWKKMSVPVCEDRTQNIGGQARGEKTLDNLNGYMPGHLMSHTNIDDIMEDYKDQLANLGAII